VFVLWPGKSQNRAFFRLVIFSDSTGHSQEKVDCLAHFAFARDFRSAAEGFGLTGVSGGIGIAWTPFSFRSEACCCWSCSSCLAVSAAAMKLRRLLVEKDGVLLVDIFLFFRCRVGAGDIESWRFCMKS